MKTFNNAILRIQADVSSFENPIDITHGDVPKYWRGNDLLVELGIFSGEGLADISNLSNIHLDIRALDNDGEAPDANSPLLMSDVCSELDSTLTLEDWKDGNKQHAKFQFSGKDSNLKPGAYWLSIWAKTKDAEAHTLTIGAGIIRVLEDGGGISTTPPEPREIYYTAEEIDEKFVPLSGVDADPNFEIAGEKVPTRAAVKQYVDSSGGPGESTTASNVGTGSGIFKEKIGANLTFKSLSAGSNITITPSDNELVISGGSGGGMANPMTTSGDMIIAGYNGNPRRLGATRKDGVYLLHCYVDALTPTIQWDTGIVVSEMWNDGACFYRQYSDGWVIQGGVVDAGATKITLYIAMVYTDYVVMCNSIGGSSDAQLMESQICPIRTTYSTVTFSAAAETKRRWVVFGF